MKVTLKGLLTATNDNRIGSTSAVLKSCAIAANSLMLSAENSMAVAHFPGAKIAGIVGLMAGHAAFLKGFCERMFPNLLRYVMSVHSEVGG